MTTAWKTAQDGDWTKARNWTDGTPDAGVDAAIVAPGAYTVALTTAVAASSLRVAGAGVVLDESASGSLAVARTISVADGAELSLHGDNPALARVLKVEDAMLRLASTEAIGAAALNLGGGSTLVVGQDVKLASRVVLSGGGDDAATVNILGEERSNTDLKVTGALVVSTDVLVGGGRFPASYVDLILAPRVATVHGDHVIQVEFGSSLTLGSRAAAALFDTSDGGDALTLRLASAASLDLGGHSLTVATIAGEQYAEIVNSGRGVTLTFNGSEEVAAEDLTGRIGVRIEGDGSYTGDWKLQGASGVVVDDGVTATLGFVRLARHGEAEIGDGAHVQAGGFYGNGAVTVGAGADLDVGYLGVDGGVHLQENATAHATGTGRLADVVLDDGTTLTIDGGFGISGLSGTGTLVFSTDDTDYAMLDHGRDFTGSLYLSNRVTIDASLLSAADIHVTDGELSIFGNGEKLPELFLNHGSVYFNTSSVVSGILHLMGGVSLSGPMLVFAPAAGSSLSGSIAFAGDCTIGSQAALDYLAEASAVYVNTGALDLNGFDGSLTSVSGVVASTASQASRLTVLGSGRLIGYGGVDLVVASSGYTLQGSFDSIKVAASGKVDLTYNSNRITIGDHVSATVDIDYRASGSRVKGFDADDVVVLKDGAYSGIQDVRFDEASDTLTVTTKGGGSLSVLFQDGFTLDDFSVTRSRDDAVITLAEGASAAHANWFEEGPEELGHLPLVGPLGHFATPSADLTALV